VGLCSGAMLSPTRVVTVAHCVDIVVGCEAVFGAHFINRVESIQTRRRIQLTDIARHEQYNPRNLTNDVAIINLRTPVATSSVAQVVKLPSGADLTNDFAGKLAVVTGWGRFSSLNVVSKALRFVQVKVITNEMCRQRFPTMIHNTTSKLIGDAIRRRESWHLQLGLGRAISDSEEWLSAVDRINFLCEWRRL
jgi:Trypsin